MFFLSFSRLRTRLPGFTRSGICTHSWKHIYAFTSRSSKPHLLLVQPQRLLSGLLRNHSNDCSWTKNPSVFALFCQRTKLSTTSQPNENKEQKEKKSEEQKSEDDFFNYYVSRCVVGFPCGLTVIYAFLVWNEMQAPGIEVDFPTLIEHLERGEIRELYVMSFKVFARFDPDLQKPPLVFRMPYSLLPWLRHEISQKENQWGITPDNRVPILLGVPYEISLSNRNYAGVFCYSLYFGGLMVGLGMILLGIPAFFMLCRRMGVQERPKVKKTEEKMSSNGFADAFRGFKLIPNYQPVKTNVRFADVAGMHACKQEVMEYVSILKEPERFRRLGARLPRGALLLGLPGTGKTLLIKALASEAGVPFYTVAGSEFIEVIGGLGASRIRELFKVARKNAPSIIFIDELDSVGGRRPESVGDGRSSAKHPATHSEFAQTLNQLLVEMDGISSSENVLVFGATNRPDMLDRALLRAGRFDRHIYVDLPNLAERKEILALYIGKSRLLPSIRPSELVEHLSKSTAGMSGADLFNICNEAALSAIRRDPDTEYVTWEDFEVALERVIAGVAKQVNPLSPSERRIAAIQEAGRTMIAWLLPHSGLTPIKASIVPRIVTTASKNFGNLGFTQFTPEDRRIYTSDELEDRMAVLLGGRAAEQILCNAVSDASQRYLSEASRLAMKQIREYGMSKVVGNLSFQEDYRNLKPYSEHTQKLIDMEAQRLVFSVYTRCVNLLVNHKQQLEALVAALIEKETLGSEELAQIFKNSVAFTNLSA